MSQSETLQPVRLDYSEKNRQVVVCPKDNDMFVRSMEQIVEACVVHERTLQRAFRFKDQLDGLLKKLAQWLLDNKHRVHKAFLAPHEGGLRFLIIKIGARYDGDLEDSLTDLDIAVATSPEFDLLQLEVLCLPEVSMEAAHSFLPLSQVLEFSRGN